MTERFIEYYRKQMVFKVSKNNNNNNRKFTEPKAEC